MSQAPWASPLFAPLRPWLDQLPPRPDSAALAALAEQTPIHTASGHRLRFVAPQDDGLAYERRIATCGEVETRPDNWHDFFNALVWLAFPRAKREISAGHARATLADGQPRGTARDALTHFDECGIVVLSRQPDLLDLLRDFQWKKLFVERRAEVESAMRFVVFGHATYEALLKPYRGLIAKAILFEVDAACLAQAPAQLLAVVDQRLADELASGRHARPRDFQPLPLLGLPGVTPENAEPAYYDDAWQFRPGRRQALAGD